MLYNISFFMLKKKNPVRFFPGEVRVYLHIERGSEIQSPVIMPGVNSLKVSQNVTLRWSRLLRRHDEALCFMLCYS